MKPVLSWLSWLCLAFAGILFLARPAHAQADDPQGLAFFESKIRPVLVEHCYACHSAGAGKSEGGLSVDTRDGLLKGGDRGPAIVPREPTKSLLLLVIEHREADLEMPLNKPRLSKSIAADVATWIKLGAPDPRNTSAVVATRKQGKHWSLVKPVRHPLPATSQPAWARRELDHFILAALDKHELTPSADASHATLLRRLYFDLTGLPPTPEEVEQFVSQLTHSPHAEGESGRVGERESVYSALVDKLLASPRFGERWGKHWLDVARYAESTGRESNLTFPHAWRYRDYVIDSINVDRPLDRFIVEQIAGDLLPFKDNAERARLLTATGFLAIGPKGLNEMNPAQFRADLIDEQIDAVSRAIMASSVACARCHDHKSDPFSMRDYYALAGIFGSTHTQFGSAIGVESNIASGLLRLPDLPGQLIPNKSMTPEHVAHLKSQVAAMNKQEADGTAAVKKAVAEGKNPDDYFTFADALRIYWTRGGIEGQLKTVDDRGNALPLAMGVADHESIEDAPRLERGEIAQPRERVPRGFPAAIELQDVAPPAGNQSGRLQLAAWLTHPDHPLTARVLANRVWRHLFGAGIVQTVDNFGASGESPSHPELLDHLALKLVDSGWSMKTLVREIVLSRAYQQGSDYREVCFQKDPDNRLLWRASKRRLDAEAIRDSMLAVSGRLDHSRRLGSLVADRGEQSVSLFGFAKEIPADLDGSRHRSVYLPVIRDRLPDALDLFDAADPSFVTGDRDTTNVPLQALYLMNSSFVQQQAAALAKRVANFSTELEEQIRHATLLCYGRQPDAAEIALAKRFLVQSNWVSYCQALMATAEFRNLD